MPQKRKRSDRASFDGARPSPHRPADTPLAQHDQDDGGGRGGAWGRGSRASFGRRDSTHGHGAQSPQGQGQQPQQPQQPQPPASPVAAKQPISPAATKPPPDAAQGQDSPTRPSYYYDLVTDDKIRSWADRGRREVVQHGVQSREDVDMTELSSLFQEFIHAVVEQRLDAADAGACVKEILGEETSGSIKDTYAFAPHTLFLDSLSIVMDNDSALFRPFLRDFLMATGVSPALMREVLDATLLQHLGLIRESFSRFSVRQATNLLYRQANYNLLREETEGYSKLITEIFGSNSGPPPAPAKVFERVKALIGTFDLDVGRVLDVTLDVAAAVLIKQFKFFIKFLRVSSWWPSSRLDDGSPFLGGLPTWANPDYPDWVTTDEDEAENERLRQERDVAFWDRARQVHIAAFFELGGRRVTDRHLRQNHITNGHDGAEAVTDAEQQWVQATKTLPPPGNRVAAQLLGFKLRFYNSDTRDTTDVLPANLLYLAALLIKIGFVSLIDLWPHLSPSNDDMERVRQQEAEKLEKEEQAARGGQMNALLMAGVLPQGDDDNPAAPGGARKELPKKAEPETKNPSADEAANKHKLPEPLEQKASLLIQLLTIGALPESLFILGRFPWISDVFPDVLLRIHRILHVCLDKVYKESRPEPKCPVELPTKNMPDADQAGVPKGSVRLDRPPPKKVWRWPFPDTYDTNENSNYRFYLDEWADNVPVCQTVDDVFTLCNTFLNLSGVNIGKDEALLGKLAGIGRKSLVVDGSQANRARWQDLLRRLLLPALSHSKANAAVVNAIWELVEQYPLVVRYSMYAEWFEGQVSRMPAMRKVFARSASETRATMKRVSLTNLGEMAKRLAKTSYASPGIVFKVAFEQLEVYSNLIDAFVECAKYFTALSYDVLVWSLLSSLGKSRSRTQADHALTTSKWLQALSRFSGRVFRRYSNLNPVPVLKYVDEQLLEGNSTDLIILKEFISSMGGIVDAVDFTDAQVLSMAGGAWLRRQTLIRAQDKRFENVKSSDRLVQALSDSKLAARLLVNLVQYRQAATYRVPEDEAHTKYLSSIIDDSHQTLMQYLDFLWSNLDPDAFDAIVPSIPELMASFGFQANLAFLVGRASLAHRMFPWKDVKAKRDAQPARKSASDKEGDVKMTDAKPQATETTEPEATEPESQQKPEDTSLSRTAFTALQPVVESVRATVRPEVWQKFAPELYSTFWALQLGDFCFPEESYVKERQRIMDEWQAVTNDRSDMTRKGMNQKAERKKELMDTQGYLLDELSQHGLRKAKWKFYLTKLFQTSFPNAEAKPDAVSDALLGHCFLPRVLVSAADAEYTYRFIKALHEWNAPVFKLMSLYDRLFSSNRLRSLIFTCTVREAEHLGRFLRLTLGDLARWHKNEPVPGDKDAKSTKDPARPGAYDKEAKGPSDQPRLGFALTVNEQGKPETFVEHAQFRDLLFRWHKNLNTALKTCLGGSEWMHIRNAITVLKAVLDHFPAVDFMATQFTAQLQRITQREAAQKESPESEEGGRVDLSVAAQGAMSELQKRKSRWVMVQAFRSNAAGGQPAGPRPDAVKPPGSKLHPNAPDFKPQAAKPSPSKPPANEEEDGEVRDAKDAGKGRSGTGTPKEPLGSSRPSESARDSSSRHDDGPGPTRSSTPRAGPAQSSTDARLHKLPDRPAGHNLPSRPDVPIPGHIPPERYGQSRGHDRRDGRDSREPRGPRDSREPREPWDGRDNREAREPREAREQRASEPDRPGRAPEFPERRAADGTSNGARPDLPPRPGQHERDRQYRDARGGRPQDRHNGLQAQPQPGPIPAASEGPEAAINHVRAALLTEDGADRPVRGAEPDRQPRAHRQAGTDAVELFNPERAALAEERNDGGHGFQNRLRRDDGHERGPRAPSPRRTGRPGGPEHAPGAGGYDDRQQGGRPYPPDQRAPGRELRDRSPLSGSNTGYAGGRPADRDGERGADKMRDASGFHRPGPRSGQEQPDHRMHHQDQNYGRLNPIPSSADAPSGPRGRGRSAIRGGYGAHSSTPGRADGRFGGAPETPRAPSPDRAPPTGPAASGRGRRGGYEHSAGPATPTGTPGGGPAYPDRQRSYGPGPDMQAPASAKAMPASGVHPDRLAQMGAGLPQPPPPCHAPGPPLHGHGRHANAADRHVSGLRQAHAGGGMGPLPSEPSVPTGPASANDRFRGGGGRRQLAGINSMLQQAQSMPDLGRNVVGPRGGQPRQLLGNSDAQVLTGGSPASTPGQERQDVMWHDSAGWGPTNGGDGAARREHRGGERDGRLERPSRSSRRSSRERERERSPRPSPRPGREGESKDHGEYHGEYRERERRAMGGGGMETPGKERDARRPARDSGGRELMGPPHGGARNLMAGRDLRLRGDGGSGGMRAAEDWTGNGGGYRGGRGGPRDGGLRAPDLRAAEDRRDDGRDDRGRKRRTEEGMGNMTSDRDKRPRRG